MRARARARARTHTHIIIIIGIQPLGLFGQRPELSQSTGIALVNCILGKLLGVVCHCFPPTHIYVYIYRVSQEECARLREGVPYVKVYRYNPKHRCPDLNGYGDNGQRKVLSSGGSTHCTCQLTILFMSVLECGVILRQFSSRSL